MLRKKTIELLTALRERRVVDVEQIRPGTGRLRARLARLVPAIHVTAAASATAAADAYAAAVGAVGFEGVVRRRVGAGGRR